MPHGTCFAWQQNVLLLHVVSDALTAFAYFSIPVVLVFFAGKRGDLPFKWLFVMFGAFIVTCGTTHLLAIWTIWRPDYWFEGSIKALTAVISIGTAFALVKVVPKALAFRSPGELERLNVRLEIATAELRATVEILGDGILVYAQDRTILRSNSAATEMMRDVNRYGRVVVQGDGAVLPEERWPSVLAFASGESQTGMLIGTGDATDRRWYLVSATPLLFTEDRTAVTRVVMSMRDVTELKARETEQRSYTRQLYALHLIATMTSGDRTEQIEGALRAGLEPLGLEGAYFGAIDVSTGDFVIECSLGAADGALGGFDVGKRYPLRNTFIGRAIEQKHVLAILDLEAEARRTGYTHYKGGRAYIAVPIFIDGSAYGAIGFIGITPRAIPFSRENVEFVQLAGDLVASAIQRAVQSERLDALDFFDALTGLPNRVLLYDRVVQTILASQRRGERFAVLFLDLDGFKAVNDNFGHGCGDNVLKVVAARLKEALRESDTVARLGGDEFVIVGAGIATMADAATFAERILRTMRRPIADGENVHELSASIGVSFYPVDGIEMKSLIDRADLALYEAKRAGKNRVSFASSLPEPASIEQPHEQSHEGEKRELSTSA